MIYYNGPVSELFGYGILGKNLLKELSKKTTVGYIEDGYVLAFRDEDDDDLVKKYKVENVDGKVDSPIIFVVNPDFSKARRGLWGNPSIGHFYYEKEELTDEMIQNMKRDFDLMIAGSKWNEKILRDHGIENVKTIQQGVDREIFNKKGKTSPYGDNFVLFSGGKFEHRKAQDIAYAAFKVAKERHGDICLVTTWTNLFDKDAKILGVGEKDIYHMGLMDQKGLAGVMCDSDIGVFPNRCEGGTNLVLMEYLACGRPVVANDSTGQKDVLDREYAYIVSPKNDADLLDQTIEGIEWAYDHRGELQKMGDKADKAMDSFTWNITAEKFLEACK